MSSSAQPAFLRRSLEGLASALGVGRVFRAFLARSGRFVLMFHGIHRKVWPGVSPSSQSGLTSEELREILGWLVPRFRILSPHQFFRTDSHGALLTFDDGLANNVTNALPVLESFGAPAVLFVTTQHVINPRNWLPFTKKKVAGNWDSEAEVPPDVGADLFDGMSLEQLRACAAHPLISIGSHSVSHPFLTRCDEGDLTHELVDSKRFLEDVSGEACDLFAYPTGDYDGRVAAAVRRAGYRYAFAVDAKGSGPSRYEIPRVGIYRAGRAYLDLKLSGLHRRPIHRRGWLDGVGGQE
jgi:peptidoglycan/xylan/chitin deacetylase (PgdA/CDA1 family)